MPREPVNSKTIEHICRLYELGRPLSAQRAGGTAGMNTKLRTTKGTFFVRCRSAEHTRIDQIRYDHHLLARLDEEGFPVASPLVNRKGGTYAQRGERIFELTRWVSGERFRQGDRTQLAELGRQVGRLHQITAEMGDRKDKPWEQRPEYLRAELKRWTDGVDPAGRGPLLDRLDGKLQTLAGRLDDRTCAELPQAIVHGDLHPGNALFAGERLAGLFDWDWANRQMRITDICDAVFFFARRPPNPFSGDEVWAMTCAFELDQQLAATVLEAYESVDPLSPAEKRLLSGFLIARWLQERIRGMRKVPPERRMEFLDRGDLLDVLERLSRFTLT